MWIPAAFLSAFFAGITAVLAKIGIKNINSSLATAIRTVVVLIFSWIIVFIFDDIENISKITFKTLVFLILSGISTGASWLCYFKALQLGNVNKVVPIDKTSTVLTMILAFCFLGEPLTFTLFLGMILILLGTFMMISKKEDNRDIKSRKWLIYALLSAFFASITSILGKIGVENISSNLATAVRTIAVLLMAWIIVFLQKSQNEIKKTDLKTFLFLILSGFSTGASWLCYYSALKTGPASIVAPIDKLSILVSIGFAYFFLGEKLTKKAFLGLIFVTAGTLILLI